ncbi:hypothetical protein BDF19DRAFT_184937 [Syncephalis fuscata]|nr:hypothetical protein BDF19DRAFT_184937 [Syncephalis fuscata]
MQLAGQHSNMTSQSTINGQASTTSWHERSIQPPTITSPILTGPTLLHGSTETMTSSHPSYYWHGQHVNTSDHLPRMTTSNEHHFISEENTLATTGMIQQQHRRSTNRPRDPDSTDTEPEPELSVLNYHSRKISPSKEVVNTSSIPSTTIGTHQSNLGVNHYTQPNPAPTSDLYTLASIALPSDPITDPMVYSSTDTTTSTATVPVSATWTTTTTTTDKIVSEIVPAPPPATASSSSSSHTHPTLK